MTMFISVISRISFSLSLFNFHFIRYSHNEVAWNPINRLRLSLSLKVGSRNDPRVS